MHIRQKLSISRFSICRKHQRRSSGFWTMFISESRDPAQMAHNKGEVDDIDLPEAVGEYMLNTNPDYSIAAITITKPMYFAFGFRKDDGAALRDKFNEVLAVVHYIGSRREQYTYGCYFCEIHTLHITHDFHVARKTICTFTRFHCTGYCLAHNFRR